MGRVGLMQPYMRPIYPGAQACGTAVTVLLQPGDNWMMHVAAEQIAARRRRGRGLHRREHRRLLRRSAGDQLSRRAAPGAGHRRRRARREGSRPRCSSRCFRRAISAKGTVKATLGSVNIPVVCAGALVNPGDVIVADADGVVVRSGGASRSRRPMPPRRARPTKATSAPSSPPACSGLDMYKMREPLAKAGLKYID